MPESKEGEGEFAVERLHPGRLRQAMEVRRDNYFPRSSADRDIDHQNSLDSSPGMAVATMVRSRTTMNMLRKIMHAAGPV